MERALEESVACKKVLVPRKWQPAKPTARHTQGMDGDGGGGRVLVARKYDPDYRAAVPAAADPNAPSGVGASSGCGD
jgi:hypothetical protein